MFSVRKGVLDDVADLCFQSDGEFEYLPDVKRRRLSDVEGIFET